MPRIGVIGSLVWDLIYGRDPLAPPVEEWGGIAYALAGLEASLRPDWQIVPLIKVGRDLSSEARQLLSGLTRLAPGGRCVEVTAPNNRVVLHYQSTERRCERMAGGVPGWTWAELGPMVRDLDAIYLNFISGFELCLGTAQALRQGFPGPIYADFHSLFLGMQQDGMRVLRPLPDAAEWFRCFDLIQLNEDEMMQLSPDPLTLSAQALEAGVSLLTVTLGPKGAAYVAAPGFDGLAGKQVSGSAGQRVSGSAGRLGVTPSESEPFASAQDRLRETKRGGQSHTVSTPVRSALIKAPAVETLDPTGCGDVFGAAAFARLLAGDPVEAALHHASGFAARNAGFRGASGLARHLRGELVTP
jgi:hypothetical protein